MFKINGNTVLSPQVLIEIGLNSHKYQYHGGEYQNNLENQGNTCYMDSLLTTFFMTIPMRKYFLNEIKFDSESLLSCEKQPEVLL